MAQKISSSRQSAYIARNRAKIIAAGQEVLAEIGPTATIEEIAEFAKVSPTTLYKYFPSKEILFSESLKEIWEKWVTWSHGGETRDESLEVFLDTARKLFWVKQTHPLFAKILQNTLSDPSFIMSSVRESGEQALRALAQRAILKNEDFEKRILIFGYACAGILTAVHVTQELSPTEAEVSLGLALSIWGLNEKKAQSLVTRKLKFAPVN